MNIALKKTKRLALGCFFLVLLTLPALAIGQQNKIDMTIKIPYKSKSYFGRPLAWDGREMMLLRRDGKISVLPVKSERDYSRVKTGFDPYSPEDIRVRLQKEFGSKYQVSITQNFVVVHPPGDFNVWAMPFQLLFSRFDAYFSTRGFQLDEPEFPLVAVVLRTRNEFDRFLRSYHDYDRNILGYYSPRSNRVITYDQTGGRSNDKDWFFNTDTIIHEATHQTAFNTGVHSRFGPAVRWASEGLAMLFEARGVNNSMYYSKLSDRVNRDRLAQLKSYYKQGKVKGKMAKLVTSNDLFRNEPHVAYAVSWGMTFFFSEKMPSQYHRYLRNDSQRTDFSQYSKKQRAADFASAFGSEVAGLEAQMERFFADLRIPTKSR